MSRKFFVSVPKYYPTVQPDFPDTCKIPAFFYIEVQAQSSNDCICFPVIGIPVWHTFNGVINDAERLDISLHLLSEGAVQGDIAIDEIKVLNYRNVQVG